jgi:hypothetical protein
MTKKVRAKPDTFLYQQRKNRLRVGARNDDALCASAAFGGVFRARQASPLRKKSSGSPRDFLEMITAQK